MKSRVKTLLNISVADASKDMLIDTLINLSEQKLLPLLNDALTVPHELEFIVVEMTVNRFNKLGSEGITSESIADINKTYSNTNELAEYMTYINKYNLASKSKFRFL